MAELKWDEVGEKVYETGTKRGVIYIPNDQGVYDKGYAWNGLTAVTESPSGAESTKLWADDQKYADLTSAEEFGATIEAYTYPDEFAKCDGSEELTDGVFIGQQERSPFGFSYTTTVGNDVKGNAYGEKIHLVYGCKATPSDKSYSTINDSPDAITFSWELTTTPVPVKDKKPTACLTIDTTKVKSTDNLKKLKDIIYGTAETEARLPMPEEVAAIIEKGQYTPVGA